MDKYAVVGNPIAHSKSPLIHKLFAEQTQQSMSYIAMLSESESFEKDVSDFFERDGMGLNITVPFKLKAYDFSNEVNERAKLAGAVNTLIKKEGRVVGDNTDGVGLVNDISINKKFNLKNKKILLIGAGGASRGIIAPLFEKSSASITIVNRTESKAEQLAKGFSHLGETHALGFDALKNQEPYDLLINASSAGLSGEAPAIPKGLSIENSFCYDMVYSKSTTPFIEWAKSRGCTYTADGLGMLVEQAAESFYLWRGVRPETEVVLKQLRTEIA